jgi:hypothetical protein
MGSSPWLQQVSAFPYAEPKDCSPHSWSLFKIQFNIIMTFMLCFSKWSLSFKIITKHWMHFSFPFHVRRMHRSSYFPWLYHSALRQGGQSWISSWSAIILSSFLSLSPSYAQTCPFSISFFNTLIVWSCSSRSMIEGSFTVIQYNGQRHGCVYTNLQVFS